MKNVYPLSQWAQRKALEARSTGTHSSTTTIIYLKQCGH